MPCQGCSLTGNHTLACGPAISGVILSVNQLCHLLQEFAAPHLFQHLHHVGSNRFFMQAEPASGHF